MKKLPMNPQHNQNGTIQGRSALRCAVFHIYCGKNTHVAYHFFNTQNPETSIMQNLQIIHIIFGTKVCIFG